MGDKKSKKKDGKKDKKEKKGKKKDKKKQKKDKQEEDSQPADPSSEDPLPDRDARASSPADTQISAQQESATDAPIEPTEKKKLTKKVYEKELSRLQVELVKLQEWVKAQKLKVVVIFEGRDAAGKGGVIKRITQCLNPRTARVVALGVPTEREKSQWYFQRYVPHLPAAGEIVLLTAPGTTGPVWNASWASARTRNTGNSCVPALSLSACWSGLASSSSNIGFLSATKNRKNASSLAWKTAPSAGN